MPAVYVDANILLRYLTHEPPEQAERVARLFAAVAAGETELRLEDVVLAEVVWTLSSYYRIDRQEIARVLLVMLAEEGIVNPDKAALERALALYGRHNVDFVDAFLAAKALAADPPEVYSFDRDFDPRIADVYRCTRKRSLLWIS